MADTDPSRLGQVNASGDELALFLKVFSGEVMTEFETSTKMLSRHRIRTISSGKSASFPALGSASASYHTPGEDILDSTNGYLNKIKANERIINIDELLIAPTFVAHIDEAMNHYDVRAPYAMELGRALAYKFDMNVAQVGLLAARATATVTGGPDGTIVTEANAKTDADTLVSAILQSAQALDEKDVPEEGRFALMRPDQYWLLINSSKAINVDYGGSGGIASGKIWTVGGIEIVKSNHLPITDLGANPTGARNTYNANFNTTAALVMHPYACGTVKLLDIKSETDYSVAHQGSLLLSKYAMGHGILRPECAVEVRTGVPV